MPSFPRQASVCARWFSLARNPPPVCFPSHVTFSALTRHSGTLFRASQFLAEELPIRLAHRVQELNDLPDGLNEMPSVNKVKDWYAQSFEVWFPSSTLRTATDMRSRKSQLYLGPTSPLRFARA